MYQIMRTFVETGYSDTMPLDHTPRFVAGYEAAGTGYAIGYMRALVERADLCSSRIASSTPSGGLRAVRSNSHR